MPRDPLILRSWTDADESGMLALERLVWGATEMAKSDFFDWQYRKNPAGRALIWCYENLDGMIVSQYAVIPVPLKVGSNRILGSLSLNTVTHPDYRRRGLFVKAAEALYSKLALREIPLTYGFPNEASYAGFVNKLGFAPLGRPTVLVRILDPTAFLLRADPCRWNRIVREAGRFLFGRVTNIDSRISVSEKIDFDFLETERLLEHTGFVLWRDSDWLTWRYLAHPFRKYRMELAGDSDNPCGLAIYQITTARNLKIGYLMDLLLSPDAEVGMVASLISRVVDICHIEGCAAITFLAARNSRKSVLLRQCGFWPVPQKLVPGPALILRWHLPATTNISLTDIDMSYGMLDTL